MRLRPISGHSRHGESISRATARDCGEKLSHHGEAPLKSPDEAISSGLVVVAREAGISGSAPPAHRGDATAKAPGVPFVSVDRMASYLCDGAKLPLGQA